MYSSHLIWLIVTGFILLLAMVGAISITIGSTSKEVVNNNLYTPSNLSKTQGSARSPASIINSRRHHSTVACSNRRLDPN
jgi:flagellar basal body-associated protein FliL